MNAGFCVKHVNLDGDSLKREDTTCHMCSTLLLHEVFGKRN